MSSKKSKLRHKGAGSLIERRGRWLARWWQQGADGTWKRCTTTLPAGTSKTEAETWLRQKQGAVDQGVRLPSRMTVAEWANGGFRDWLALHVKESTRSNMTSYLAVHILPRFSNTALADITPEQVNAWLAEKQKTLSTKTVHTLYQALQSVMREAKRAKLIQTNPIGEMEPPRFTTREKPILTPQEVAKVIAAMEPQYQPIFRWLWESGLRIGEAIAIHWEDVDLLNGTVAIRRAIWRGREQPPKTAKSQRMKFLSPAMVQVFTAWRATARYAQPGDLVFPTEAGTPWNVENLRTRVLYIAMASAGIKRERFCHGFHIFRHSAVSNVLAQSHDLKMASSFAGHSGVAITANIYGHLLPDAEREAVARHSQALDGAPSNRVQ
jgi:integrase